ncbi:response regulator [Nostoc sp. FACHB-110]|uniref:response regulator n=1 Tax=Nostoc sp. FACHB-110 TaxID=2692834 RepID=UPI001685AC3C|nr:response regulator [Nostoc sp. FACHB-110]MBD2441565.1 response regulator [Nostoc sp. FACHB-110]
MNFPHDLLNSEVGKGSCFTVRLPYSEASLFSQISTSSLLNAHQDLTEEFSPVQAVVTTPPPKQPLILLAEDNEANIETLASYLHNQGYRLILAKNGRAAIDIAITHHPDLILMDIQMPGIDGLEAIRQIRANPSLASITIIALTALAMPQDREKCLAAGADEYLPKPVKLKHLVTVIQQLLTQDKSIGETKNSKFNI